MEYSEVFRNPTWVRNDLLPLKATKDCAMIKKLEDVDSNTAMNGAGSESFVRPADTPVGGSEALALLQFKPTSKRRILLVFPEYTKSFGTFDHAFHLMGGVRAFMPPQGILLIGELLPREWEVRFVDENIECAKPEDFQWADVVFTSGMHIQRPRLHNIIKRGHEAGKVVALGGPSVSSAPEYYPDADLIQCGEAGDSTLRLFERIDSTIERPSRQIVYKTLDRLSLQDFPIPGYHRINIMEYMLGSVQFSSGCPFTCEFCDIPGLYGRNPRLKSPEQIVAELEAMAEGGMQSCYFVDDNFVGNPKAARELLPTLIKWQKKRDYQVRLSCEATMNMVKYPDLLKMMQEAGFTNCFMGIETPEPDALKAMKKTQNLRTPLLEAINMMNQHGMEVASGIIMGFDTDTDRTPDAIIEFAEQSNIPIMTVNILYALPFTPLHDRLTREDRIIPEEECTHLDSNIRFKRPYEDVVRDWLRVIRTIYSPEKLYKRYDYNSRHTYPNQAKPARPLQQATWPNMKRAMAIMKNLVWYDGIRSDYKQHFWNMWWREMRQGEVENVFKIGLVAHHLITYARECMQGKLQASNYSHRNTDEDQHDRPLKATRAPGALSEEMQQV